jgi:hypothetical protein
LYSEPQGLKPGGEGRIGTAEALPSRRQEKDGQLKVAATRSEAKAAAGLPQSKRGRCASRRAAVMENASGTPIRVHNMSLITL